MNHPLTGGCLCRKLRYEITEVPQLTYTCHCTDCQHLSGGAFTMAIAVPAAAFRLTGIGPRQYRAVADSGRVKIRFVCPECGTWVWGVSSSDTGVFRFGRVHWMTRQGSNRRCTFGHAANSFGSYCPTATRRSRHNQPTNHLLIRVQQGLETSD
jgi:hypothetical protein